jgi:hypothetical protein
MVFLDYQNAYRTVRGAYFDHELDPHWYGQLNPLALGQHLAADSPFDRELAEVRIYRGLPSSKRDPKGYGAARRQITRWDAMRGVTVVTRAIRYPHGWPDDCGDERPQEKGIDVALALDFAMMGERGQYDVGILVSGDTDLKPALESVAYARRDNGEGARAEVAAWSAEGKRGRRLAIDGVNLFCHWMGRDVYDQVCDLQDYNQPLPPGLVPRGL